MPNPLETLRSRIDQRQVLVGVIGLGYVGLPLLQAFNKAGFRTIGYDIDQAKVDRLLAGESYIRHIPAE
jgi:UDP-N-acetyl-D-glucosamine dehydrogenase